MPPPRLTAMLRHNIVSAIRAGCYAHVAAQAWGVPAAVFKQWIARGSRKMARDPYRAFARVKAEAEVFRKDPRIWLEHGPGKERADSAGWSGSVKAFETKTTDEQHDVWQTPELMNLFRFVLDALQRYPEARGHVARALMNASDKRAGELR